MKPLKSNRLELRAMEPADVELLYQWENDPEIWHLSTTLTPFSRHLLEQYVLAENDLYSNKQLRLMICTLNGDTIGTVDLFDFSPFHQRAGIGILIAAHNQREKGLGTETIDLMIRYAFDTLQLKQLYCNVLSSNEASLQLFKKMGFQVIGTKKDWIRQGDTWTDEILLQLLASDVAK